MLDKMIKKPLTQKRLKEVLNYNPRTGVFVWKTTMQSRSCAGSVAGCIDKSTGYRKVSIDYRRYYSHRLAFLYMSGRFPKFVDHKNMNTSDNRWSNLREATKSQNNANSVRGGRSGHKGVCKDRSKRGIKNPWFAYLDHNGKRKYLGVYKSKATAIKAYRKAAKKVYRTFARFS